MPEGMTPGSPYWRQNLYVCLFGSFTTIIAMTLLVPFLPVYVEQLGVTSPAAIVQWSGIAFGATFFAAGLMAPVWGKLADRYGRKPILIRASLGMAISMSLIGVAQNVWQLVAFRLLAGLLGGYSSGSTVLVAMQTPRNRSGWALGMLSTGVMAGSLVGPLIGGALPALIGVRETFFLAGGVIFVAFLGTIFFIREDRVAAPVKSVQRKRRGAWVVVEQRAVVAAMLGTAMLVMLANMSIEPIITVYVGQLMQSGSNVVLTSGFIMSASAFGSVLAAARVGKLADRLGAWNVIMGCLVLTGVLLLPQAFVTQAWQLGALRFLMGLSLGGLLPSVTALLRHNVPDSVVGTMLGYSISAQFAGQVTGPLLGGYIGGHVGIRAVFLATSTLMFAGAACNWSVSRRRGRGG
jgi:MFS family permease